MRPIVYSENNQLQNSVRGVLHLWSILELIVLRIGEMIDSEIYFFAIETRVRVRTHTGAQRAPYQSMRIQVRAVQTAGNALTVNTHTAHVRVRARTGTRFAVGCIW
jgi:hypothetical protein